MICPINNERNKVNHPPTTQRTNSAYLEHSLTQPHISIQVCPARLNSSSNNLITQKGKSSMAAQLQRLLTITGTAAVGIGATAWVGSECLFNVDGGERVVIFDRFRGILSEVRLFFVERNCWTRITNVKST